MSVGYNPALCPAAPGPQAQFGRRVVVRRWRSQCPSRNLILWLENVGIFDLLTTTLRHGHHRVAELQGPAALASESATWSATTVRLACDRPVMPVIAGAPGVVIAATGVPAVLAVAVPSPLAFTALI